MDKIRKEDGNFYTFFSNSAMTNILMKLYELIILLSFKKLNFLQKHTSCWHFSRWIVIRLNANTSSCFLFSSIMLIISSMYIFASSSLETMSIPYKMRWFFLYFLYWERAMKARNDVEKVDKMKLLAISGKDEIMEIIRRIYRITVMTFL